MSVNSLEAYSYLSSDALEKVFELNGEKKILIDTEHSLVCVEKNKVTSVVNDLGAYKFLSNKNTKYYFIYKAEIEIAAVEGKIKISNEESYEGTIRLQIKDPAKFIKSAKFEKIKANDYFDTYLKDDLKKNLNTAITNIANEKKLAVKDINDDDLSNELEKLIKTEENNGVKLIVNLK